MTRLRGGDPEAEGLAHVGGHRRVRRSRGTGDRRTVAQPLPGQGDLDGAQVPSFPVKVLPSSAAPVMVGTALLVIVPAATVDVSFEVRTSGV